MRIRDVLRTKGPNVITIAPETSVQEATRVLVRHRIGALVVSDGKLRGMVTERDLLHRAAEDIHGLATCRVQDIMTREVITATPDAEIREVMDIMTEHRIRHLPVVVDGALTGIISIGDVVKTRVDELETEKDQLVDYIRSGR